MLTVTPYYVAPQIAHRLPHEVGGQENRLPPPRGAALVPCIFIDGIASLGPIIVKVVKQVV